MKDSLIMTVPILLILQGIGVITVADWIYSILVKRWTVVSSYPHMADSRYHFSTKRRAENFVRECLDRGDSLGTFKIVRYVETKIP